MRIAVTDSRLPEVQAGSATSLFAHWVDGGQLLAITPGEVLPLQAHFVAKPWGREIWFTAVEERGVCCVVRDGRSLPLPWLQAVMPGDLYRQPGDDLILLKILDPLPQPVLGDLYFELHLEKREVYVVTHVDEAAWPDGCGYIRFGFCPERIAACGDEARFRTRYLEAVRAYEVVRRKIDGLERPEEASQALRQDEAALRREMESYTALRPLAVGDVVVVPRRLPHSLLHGVRTVEFQTPVYERQILSFAQKVLTQSHWDTAEAVNSMLLTPPPEASPDVLLDEAGVRIERIVNFADFEVLRITIDPGESWQVKPLGTYGILMCIDCAVALDGTALEHEDAALLPRGWASEITPADRQAPATLLLALPVVAVVEHQ